MSNDESTDGIFRESDFHSIKLGIAVKNLTTNTEISHNKVHLDEFGDHSLILELPLKCCNKKHSLMLSIEKMHHQTPAKNEHLFDATGSVIEMEETDEGTVRVTVKLVQYEEKAWDDLLKIYSSRQDEITKFIAAVKGY